MRIYYFDTKKDTEGSKFEKSCKKWKKFPVMIIEHKDKVVPFSFSKRKMSNKVLTFCIDDAVSLLAKDYPELRPDRYCEEYIQQLFKLCDNSTDKLEKEIEKLKQENVRLKKFLL